MKKRTRLIELKPYPLLDADKTEVFTANKIGLKYRVSIAYSGEYDKHYRYYVDFDTSDEAIKYIDDSKAATENHKAKQPKDKKIGKRLKAARAKGIIGAEVVNLLIEKTDVSEIEELFNDCQLEHKDESLEEENISDNLGFEDMRLDIFDDEIISADNVVEINANGRR